MNYSDSKTKSLSFGQLVKNLRQAADLMQKELADRTGCATISIRRIEAGSLRPSTQLAEQLAAVLDIPPSEHEDFIKLARSVSNNRKGAKEKMNQFHLDVEQGIDSRMWRPTEFFLSLLPLIIFLAVLALNPRYMAALTAIEPPFIIPNILPWGWMIFALVIALMVISKVVLQNGRLGQDKQQIYYRTGINGFVLLFLTFPAILLILLAPALLHALRSS